MKLLQNLRPMNYIFFDTKRNYENLLPLTFTRPISELRIGILTIKQKWEKYCNSAFSNITQTHLQQKFPMTLSYENILINSSILPNRNLVDEINKLKTNTFLKKDNNIIAVKLNDKATKKFKEINFLDLKPIESFSDVSAITNFTDIFSKNEKEIENDFKLLTINRQSEPIDSTNSFYDSQNIFIEKGANVKHAILNPLGGYIYIGKNATIMENSVIRGSFALCENSQLKIGAKIYGATTIGPNSKVGGEINNSVIFGYSNKAHDGFLGNSVIGEWCNIGADSNNSNLKNTYQNVKLWNYRVKKFADTGVQFCGLIMADHAKCGINTMFNTGTVVGVSANIFGTGFPRNFVPSFSWGGANSMKEYKFENAIETAKLVMARRNLELTELDESILKYAFDTDKEFRH